MKTKKLVLTALFAALTACGCFIQIPLPGGIPIVIQDMMAMLSGLILGPLYGGFAVLVFLILGIIGLPVYSGKAGLHVLLKGPTGGFLFGYLLAAVIGGLILHFLLKKKYDEKEEEIAYSNKYQYAVIAIAAFSATAVCFILGIIGFKMVTHKELSLVLKAVLLPFIPGNIIKLIIMIPVTKIFRKVVWSE